MTPETAVVQALNGISFGALLFILAAGLSLIFGMMDVVNLAHGAFYMLGAYITLSVVQRTGQFWLALVLAPLLIGALGLLMEPLLLRRLRGRHLDQVLLTIGVSLVIADLVGLTWGREIRSVPFPAGLDHAITILGGDYPVYRLFVIAFGAALAVILAVVHRRTRVGALIRAGVDDAPMLAALRVDIDRLVAVTCDAVGALGGRVIDDAELRRISHTRSKYNSAAIGEGVNVLLDDDEVIARGNHSCDSNLWMRDELMLEARRDIATGEEVTIDYALQTSVADWEMACNCGSALCRKVVRGDDWLRPELQDRYRGHFSPFLNERIAGMDAEE